jgi:hypothetical protein
VERASPCGRLFVLVEARAAGCWGRAAVARRSARRGGQPGSLNNLPSGLLAGGPLQTVKVPAFIRESVLIGIDLGPNLSVTGSLATVLWLIALRREGEQISGWQFLKMYINSRQDQAIIRRHWALAVSPVDVP